MDFSNASHFVDLLYKSVFLKRVCLSARVCSIIEKKKWRISCHAFQPNCLSKAFVSFGNIPDHSSSLDNEHIQHTCTHDIKKGVSRCRYEQREKAQYLMS